MACKILSVDDEPVILDFEYELLSELPDTEVHKASSGLDALKQMESTVYDIIVSDIRMPGLTGIEMLKKMRELNYLAPVIFVTGFADNKNHYDAWKNGAYDFIEKPFEPDVLLKVVQSAMHYGKSYLESRESKSTDVMVEVKVQVEAKVYSAFKMACSKTSTNESVVLANFIASYGRSVK